MGKYTIYLRRNKINGKCYVGQTSNFKRREYYWNCLKQKYANDYISNDRVKYGFDAWSVEILAEVDTREEAWELEKRFINDYSTIYPKGYNLAKGGAGPSGCKCSDKTKQKISKFQKGKHLSKKTIEKISDASPKKQVYQYTLDGTLVKIWSSTRECGRNGYHCGCISMCCNGKLKTHKGFKWSYNKM